MARIPKAQGQEQPFCDMRVAEGPVAGTLLADGNLELDLGCRYRVWQGPEAAEALAGETKT